MRTLSHPVRILILTSIRDVGADDRVGQIVPTENCPEYMEGIVHRTLTECLPGGKLHGLAEVSAIITDDKPRDLVGSGYTVEPDPCGKWIFPLDLPCNAQGDKATSLVRNIPSYFRSVPKRDAADRRESKRAYEEQIFDAMKESGASVLVSDHYMAKIEFLFTEEFGLYGKMLNIHPAVTKLDSCYCLRGATPTADALARARTGKITRTGATLHIINKEFDDGPIVEWDAPTPVYPDDMPEWLRYRNYQMAKLPVFVNGMVRYITEVLPTL